MKMSRISVTLLAVCSVLGVVCVAAQEASVIYINEPLEWEEIARPDRSPERIAKLMIVVLDADGSLAIVSAFGEESPEGSEVRVLYSEGYSTSSGSWTMADGALSVRHKPIYASVPPITGDRSRRSEVWKDTRAQSAYPVAIDTGRTRLGQTQSLNDIDELLRIIAWRRSQADEP